MIFHQTGVFIAGLAILIVGGQALVRGSVGLARALGVSTLVVGLTVVSFGTSAPELAVCITSAVKGHDSIAVANAVGSNIVNILLILGLAAVFRVIPVARDLARIATPIMIASCALVWVFAWWGGDITRIESLILVAALAGYLWLSYRMARADNAARRLAAVAGAAPVTKRYALNTVLCVVGLVFLTCGSRLMVDAAVVIAETMGVSQVVIGLTIVAIGTSLPELATTVIAAIRDEPDIAAGNIVGSNIFNMLAIVGITGLVSPLGVDETLLWSDMPVMIAVALLLLPIFLIRGRVARLDGAVLLAVYVIYTASLLQR